MVFGDVVTEKNGLYMIVQNMTWSDPMPKNDTYIVEPECKVYFRDFMGTSCGLRWKKERRR